MAKKDFLMNQLNAFNNQEAKPTESKANAEAVKDTTPNAVAEAEQAEKSDEMRATPNYDVFTLPNPNPTTDLKGRRYQKGDPLHTERYSFQITEELAENLAYYMEYAKRHGREINQSVLLREALAKALKKEPRG